GRPGRHRPRAPPRARGRPRPRRRRRVDFPQAALRASSPRARGYRRVDFVRRTGAQKAERAAEPPTVEPDPGNAGAGRQVRRQMSDRSDVIIVGGRVIGLEVEWLLPRRCRELEPGLSTACAGGLWAATDGEVDPRALAQALAAAAERAGASIHQGAEVVRGVFDGGRLVGVETEYGTCYH